MGGKAKKEEISRKMGQTNTTTTTRDPTRDGLMTSFNSRNKANRIHLDDISKLSMVNPDETARMYDQMSVISSMGGGMPDTER